MTTKIEVAIENAKTRLKYTEQEITVLLAIKETQYLVIRDLEKLEDNKHLT